MTVLALILCDHVLMNSKQKDIENCAVLAIRADHLNAIAELCEWIITGRDQTLCNVRI